MNIQHGGLAIKNKTLAFPTSTSVRKLNFEHEPMPEEMLLGQYIPLHYHYNMLQDRARMEPFREAIEMVVPIGGKVLELGGGTGVLSYFAAQRASRVWCVERNPALVRAASAFLMSNPNGERVEVVQADAMTYLPPEPIDVVICEMLHVAMIREKQTEVIASFCDRYLEAFGPPLPKFIPDATVLAIQLLENDFCFEGYLAPVPMFVTQNTIDERSVSLSDREAYDTICYDAQIPQRFDWDSTVHVTRDGRLNAMSFFSNHFLAYHYSQRRGVAWTMNQLVLPLPNDFEVLKGDSISVRLHYASGCSMEELQSSMVVERQSHAFRMSRAA